LEQRGGQNKLSTDTFIEKSKKIHVNSDGTPKYDYSLVDYQDSNTPVKIICPKHKDKWIEKTGNEYFTIRPSKHLQGQGCRFDFIESKLKYSDQELSDEAMKFKTSSEFKRNSPLYFNASQKRGKEFYDEITSHFVFEKESSGERQISKILVDNGLIDVNCLSYRNCPNREVFFDNCVNTKKGKYCRPLRFDFYLPKLKTIIEFDGEQHFRPSKKFGGEKFETTKENDNIKNEFCKKNNINLIRIHYKFPPDKIEEELITAIQNPKPLTLIGNY
jgi:hypothetical protein